MKMCELQNQGIFKICGSFVSLWYDVCPGLDEVVFLAGSSGVGAPYVYVLW